MHDSCQCLMASAGVFAEFVRRREAGEGDGEGIPEDLEAVIRQIANNGVIRCVHGWLRPRSSHTRAESAFSQPTSQPAREGGREGGKDSTPY